MRQGWDLGVQWGIGGNKYFLSEIQPDLVCELLTWMAHAPAPGALGRDQKVKYHLIWITKSISKICKPNFVYLLTNERYITYHTGFLFGRLRHAQGWDLWVVGGSKKILQNSTRFSVWVSHMNGTCTGTIFWVPAPWGLGEGSKIKFLNMIMLHIKLKGMDSLPGYTEKF